MSTHEAHGSNRARTGDTAGATLLLERAIDEVRPVGLFGHGFYELTRGEDSDAGPACTVERGLLTPELVVPDLDGMTAEQMVGYFANLITDTGDELYTKRVASVAVNVPTGMRYGTGTTAVSKNGAGAAIVTYVSGSHLAFDATYPQTASKGAGLGWRATWKTTWGIGVATANNISEAVITNETPLTNVAGTAANTVSRALLSPTVSKGALDTLAITWLTDAQGS